MEIIFLIRSNMKHSIVLFISTSFLILCACQKIERSPSAGLQSNAILNTKGTSPNQIIEKYSVSLSDAKRYSELYRPGEAFSVTPYVEGKDTLLYLFNYREGWLVLSGDRRVVPVVAENSKGSIKMMDGTGSASWLKMYAQEVSRLKKDEEHQKDNDYTSLWKAISRRREGPGTKSESKWVIREAMINEYSVFTATVPPLLQTEWGQQDPWNYSYPLDLYYNKRCYVGCVAVAFAQLLYYWHYYSGNPTKLSHTISCYDTINSAYGLVYDIGFSRSNVTNNSSRWDDMALSASSGGNTGYVGDFMLDIGNIVQMGYTGDGSGAYLQYALYALNLYYGLSYSYGSFSESTAKAQLFSGRPIVVSSQNSIASHAWIIDGYTTETQYYSMLRYCELSTNWGLDDEVYDTFEETQAVYGFSAPYDMIPFNRVEYVNLFHMNWGENGEGNGIYTSINWYYSTSNSTFSPDNTNMATVYFQ